VARDAAIEKIFTTADDGMQGLWGFHTYMSAALAVADRARLVSMLPNRRFPLTHEWKRFYNRHDLAAQMESIGPDFLQSRASLLLLVMIFEHAICRFNRQLHGCGHAPRKSKYKNLLEWVFSVVRDSHAGSATMIKRLPDTCGDVDNARRLRNTIVHNNGMYTEKYGSDSINDDWVRMASESDWRVLEPVLITTQRFEHFSRSHIELLHILHNSIQRKFFGHLDDFNYRSEHKRIEWHKVLGGGRQVGM
jgi:hypothetical protein